MSLLSSIVGFLYEYSDAVLITVAAIFVLISPNRRVAFALFSEFSLFVVFYIWLNHNGSYVDGEVDVFMFFVATGFMFIFSALKATFLAVISFVLSVAYLMFFFVPDSIVAQYDFYVLLFIQILQLSALVPSIYRKYKREKSVVTRKVNHSLFEAVCGHAIKH